MFDLLIFLFGRFWLIWFLFNFDVGYGFGWGLLKVIILLINEIRVCDLRSKVCCIFWKFYLFWFFKLECYGWWLWFYVIVDFGFGRNRNYDGKFFRLIWKF